MMKKTKNIKMKIVKIRKLDIEFRFSFIFIIFWGTSGKIGGMAGIWNVAFIDFFFNFKIHF